MGDHRMKKTIEFGKHAIASNRRINSVDVTLELSQDKQGRDVFSACAYAWNNLHTDIVTGGQCLDTLAGRSRALRNNRLYMEILGLWQRNHLNDMHAGTRAQEKAVDEWLAGTGRRYDYGEACEYLKSIGLYEDNGYKYGHGWQYYDISDEDLKRIKEIINA